jgi:hypothetical protein
LLNVIKNAPNKGNTLNSEHFVFVKGLV